jgi:hypothetical protein
VGARAQIEASLQAHWSLDELAVYGDALIAEGDVRGELIALDLHREPRPLPIKRSRQRLALLARWLGEELAEPAYDLTRYGFVDPRPDAGEALLPVLARAEPYVRAIDFLGYHRAEITQLLETLVSAPRPWLARLAITLNGDATLRGPIVDDALAARLIAATPQLTELEIEARDLFAAFPHPAVERLRSSYRGIRTLAGDNATALPRIAELDLALSERFEFEVLDPVAAARFLPRAALPALTRLDVSCNEPGLLQPLRRGGRADVFPMLGRWPICAQLTHLRVPALHGEADLEELAGLLARLPELVELEIAHGYLDMAPLLPRLATLPRVRLPRWLWPWPHQLTTADSLVFDWELTIKTQALVAELERRHDAMPEAARDAWSRLWTLVRSLRNGETQLFPRADLALALGALGPRGLAWKQLPRPYGYTPDPDTAEITRRLR